MIGGKMYHKKGFTLLELIIVIIVIAILASIALPRFFRVTEKARTAEAKTMLATIRSAQVRYYAQHGLYTNESDNLDVELEEKFFDYYSFDGSNASIIGAAARTNIDNPNKEYNYTFTIDDEGEIGVRPPNYNYLL